jgi:hypothetical protein
MTPRIPPERVLSELAALGPDLLRVAKSDAGLADKDHLTMNEMERVRDCFIFACLNLLRRVSFGRAMLRGWPFRRGNASPLCVTPACRAHASFDQALCASFISVLLRRVGACARPISDGACTGAGTRFRARRRALRRRHSPIILRHIRFPPAQAWTDRWRFLSPSSTAS